VGWPAFRTWWCVQCSRRRVGTAGPCILAGLAQSQLPHVRTECCCSADLLRRSVRSLTITTARHLPGRPPPHHHAQDIKLHWPGTARLGEDGPVRGLPIFEVQPRNARHSSDKAPVHRNQCPARHTARHAGQSVVQCALLVESRGARP
jgi:hypothetical protein